MLSLARKYRRGYIGEDIIVERRFENGTWHTTTEHVPNQVTNNQISNRAIVIGNGPTRLDFDLSKLKVHSGLLGSKTVQTYGCNALYRDFNPDFLVATGNKGIVEEIATSGYTENNVVYSNAIHLLEFPNKFYLIPHDPYADAGTTAAYIAAFDGHTTIYLLGFDGHDAEGHNSNVYAGTNGYDELNNHVDDTKWIQNHKHLFDVYPDVEFVWVTPYGRNLIPETLKHCLNFRQINFRDLVLQADL